MKTAIAVLHPEVLQGLPELIKPGLNCGHFRVLLLTRCLCTTEVIADVAFALQIQYMHN